MKTKFSKRLLSVLLACIMVISLLPTSVFAVETETIGTDCAYMGMSFENYSSMQAKNPVKIPEGITPGETIMVPLPSNLVYDDEEEGATYTLKTIILMDNADNAEWMSEDVTDFNGSAQVTIPQDVEGPILFVYQWERVADEPEEPGKRPGIVTNVINSLTRTVAQNKKELSYETQYGMDIYRVEEDEQGMKNDLTLTYSADMDMTKLGSSFFGDNSWETLLDWYDRITDETSVDLHFQFDEKVTITDDALANANLESDMFSEKYNGDGSKQWWTITGKELILHCQWDSAKAKANMETNGKLDPMIELTGVKVALPDDWGDKDTIVIRNHGYVDGKVWAHRQSASSTGDLEWAEIDGGEKDDEFVLTTSDKVSLPGLEKKIIEDGEEKDNTSVNVKNGIVNFQLKSNVPEDLKELIEYTGNGTHDKVDVVGTIPEGEEYTLTFHDKMNSAFVVPNLFLVYLGDDMLDQTKLLELNKDYQVNFDPEDCTFEIQLDLVKLYNEGIIKDEDLGKTSITVSYNTKLKDTVTNGTFENEAWVTTSDDWETSHDTVTVDTYQIDIHKFGNGQINTEPLAGAHFKLYQKVNGEEVIVEGCDDLISEQDGHVTVDGLKAGTYYLKETRAPDGYVCSDQEVEIKIPERANEENVVKVNFDNRSIPHTGGMGTTIFSIVGGVLIAMAGTVFVISRRKRRA